MKDKIFRPMNSKYEKLDPQPQPSPTKFLKYRNRVEKWMKVRLVILLPLEQKIVMKS